MAIDWNPGTSDIIGNQMRGVGYGHRTVDASHDVAELQFEAQHTGAISHWELYAGAGAAAPVLTGRFNDVRRPVLLEMVAAGNEDSAGATYTDLPVSAIVGSASMYNANLTKPLVTSQLATPNDGLFIVSAKEDAYFEVNFAAAAFPLTWHVLAVEVRMRINLTTGVRRLDPSGEPWFYNVPEFSPQYVLHTIRWGETIIDGSGTTWKHWTPAMVREFASTRKVRFSCQAGPGAWKMDWLQMRVHHVPERRIGVGIGIPATPNSWVSFPMTTPNATGSPNVTDGADYSLMCRRITDYSPGEVGGRAVMPWRYLAADAPAADWRLHHQPWPSWAEGFSGAGERLPGTPVARAKNAGTVVATSQPYQVTTGVHVYGAQLARQRLTVPGDGTVYGQVYAMAGWVEGSGRPQDPLTAEVRRVSDGVVMFSATSRTADEVSALPAPANGVDLSGARYKLVRFRFPESLALAAGTYEVRFSSPGTTEARRWMVAALIADGHTTDQTYGGATQYASGLAILGGSATEVAPSGAYTSELQATLADVPAAVTGVTTGVGSFSAHDASICSCGPGDDGGGCAVDTLPYVHLEWDAAPTGSPDMVGYNVRRVDDWTPAEEQVAYVDGRLTTEWDDQEPRIGVVSDYQVQVVRSDGVTGDWSTVASQLVPSGNVALAFSSNYAPAMGCVYPEVWEGDEVEREWEFPGSGEVTYERFHGRNDPVAFRRLERPGPQFDRTLLLSAGCVVPSPSLDTFQPLQDLAVAPVPYVCVRDGEGNRWYASVEVPAGVNRRAGPDGHEVWLAPIRVVQVSDRPAVADTSVAPVTEPYRL